MPTSLIRIVLAPSVQVHEAIELLRGAGIAVEGGAVVLSDQKRHGVIVIGGYLDRALEVLAKTGIDASTG